MTPAGDQMIRLYESGCHAAHQLIELLKKASAEEHERLLRRVWDDLLLWPRWLERHGPALPEHEREAHEFGLRYCKGLVKLWRGWLSMQPRKRI